MPTQLRRTELEVSDQTDKRVISGRSYSSKATGDIFDRWQTLIFADRAGDTAAYDIFLAELRNWLTRYFRRRMHDDGGVEDAVQETLIAVFLQRYTYSTDDPLGPWLRTVAYRKWVDTVRRRTRATLVPLDESYCVNDHGDEVRSAVVVEACLATLKLPQRDAIVYRLIDGFSVSDTADMTGQSESLVKVNVHRGLRRLAATLALSE
jgi:RNA polymerase sigma-70 factor (ECF subfamily)